MSRSIEEPDNTNTRMGQFRDLLSGEVVLFGELFPVHLPVYDILTSTIKEGDMTQQGSERYVEYLAHLDLCQPGVSSRVKLSKDMSGKMLWAPLGLELVGPYLSKLEIDLLEEAGRAMLKVVNYPEGDVTEEVKRFLRLASNRVNS